MILVWKFPQGVDIDIVLSLKGTEGSHMNPIQDIDDNWIVSDEEYCMDEFQQLKKEYAEIYANMQRIEYKPKPQQPINHE